MDENFVLNGKKLIHNFIGTCNFTCDCDGLEEISDRCVSISNYNKSWDWLIPVVEKIESIKNDFHGYFAIYISSNSCTIQGTKLRTDPNNFHPAYYNEITANTKLEAVFRAVVEFIEWYNKNIKNVKT